jgi:hypothetical protein
MQPVNDGLYDCHTWYLIWNTELFFCKVAYTRYDVSWSVDWSKNSSLLMCRACRIKNISRCFKDPPFKVHSHISVSHQFRVSAVSDRLVKIRGKYVTVPDMSERVRYNIWQRYILELTLTELSGHVTDKREWTFMLQHQIFNAWKFTSSVLSASLEASLS